MTRSAVASTLFLALMLLPTLAARAWGQAAWSRMQGRPGGFDAMAALPGGDLLVSGHYGGYRATAAIWRAQTGHFVTTGSMSVPRAQHTLTRLQDGRVLATGGEINSVEESGVVDTAEIWDPHTGRWQAAAPMHEARRGHLATLLNDGHVVVSGRAHVGQSTEIFNPPTNRWTRIDPPEVPQLRLCALGPLEDGFVAVYDGKGRSQVVARRWDAKGWSAPLSQDVVADPSYRTILILADGRVLIVALGGAADTPNRALIWNVIDNTIVDTQLDFHTFSRLALAQLSTGEVLIGGIDGKRSELLNLESMETRPAGTSHLQIELLVALTDGRAVALSERGAELWQSADSGAILHTFGNILMSGDEAKVRAASTKRGFEQLQLQWNHDQSFAIFVRQLGENWSQGDARWEPISGKLLRGRLGAKIKSSPIVFRKLAGEWKLDDWGGPGK